MTGSPSALEANQVVLIRTGIAVTPRRPPSPSPRRPSPPATTAPAASITLGGTAGGTVSTVTLVDGLRVHGHGVRHGDLVRRRDSARRRGQRDDRHGARARPGHRHRHADGQRAELSWFLAEGATGIVLRSRLALANPGAAPRRSTITYLREGGGATVAQNLTLAPTSRTTVRVDEVPGARRPAVSHGRHVDVRRAAHRRAHHALGRCGHTGRTPRRRRRARR